MRPTNRVDQHSVEEKSTSRSPDQCFRWGGKVFATHSGSTSVHIEMSLVHKNMSHTTWGPVVLMCHLGRRLIILSSSGFWQESGEHDPIVQRCAERCCSLVSAGHAFWYYHRHAFTHKTTAQLTAAYYTYGTSTQRWYHIAKGEEKSVWATSAENWGRSSSA